MTVLKKQSEREKKNMSSLKSLQQQQQWKPGASEIFFQVLEKQNKTEQPVRAELYTQLNYQDRVWRLIQNINLKKECEIKPCLPLINASWSNPQRMYFVEKNTKSRRKDWVIKRRNGTKNGTLPTFLAPSSFIENAVSLPRERCLKDILSFWQLKPRDRFLAQLSSSTALGPPVWDIQACSPGGCQFHSDYTTGILCERTGNVRVFWVPDAVGGMIQGFPKELVLSWGSFLLMHTHTHTQSSLKGE